MARYRNAGVPRVPELFRGRAPGRSSVRELPALRLCVVAQDGTYAPLPGGSCRLTQASRPSSRTGSTRFSPRRIRCSSRAWQRPGRLIGSRQTGTSRCVGARGACERIASVTALFRDPAAMQVEATRNCLPGESTISTKLCGGFRPGLAVTLTKRERTIKLLACFSCGDAPVLRPASGVRVGLGWADIASTRERWSSAFGALAPVAQPLSPGSRCASNASASSREKARCAEWPSDLATRSI